MKCCTKVNNVFRSISAAAVLSAAFIFLSLSCSSSNSAKSSVNSGNEESLMQSCQSRLTEKKSKIYLYGEMHGYKKIYDRELELWKTHYSSGMRDLFIEVSYYSAEFLNLWMKSDSDAILDELFEDLKGTSAYTEDNKNFYKSIKQFCPETIFHGTDVGHQYSTSGERYLKYLRKNDLKNSEQYKLAEANIEQGKKYYKGSKDHVYRENAMAANFVRELIQINGADMMGIYGGAHTNPEAMDYFTKTVPCMAKQVQEQCGVQIKAEDLSDLARDIEPIRKDRIEINGTVFEASYFGKVDINVPGRKYAEFWRLENAYDAFKDRLPANNILPYNNYPMIIEEGQIYIIDYTYNDDTVKRQCFRSDGNKWQGMPATNEFTPCVSSFRKDNLTVNGKEYEALYLGKEDLSATQLKFKSREFWRLNHAYDDLKNERLTGDVLPYRNFPVALEQGQVFVIDSTDANNIITRQCFRTDGNTWKGMLAANAFEPCNSK